MFGDRTNQSITVPSAKDPGKEESVQRNTDRDARCLEPGSYNNSRILKRGLLVRLSASVFPDTPGGEGGCSWTKPSPEGRNGGDIKSFAESRKKRKEVSMNFYKPKSG